MGEKNGKKRKAVRGKKKRNRKMKKNKFGSKQRTTRTCSGSDQVTDECLENAVEVFKYLRNQVRTFNRKYARITSFNKIIGNKKNKSGVFEETAAYLLLALGGNLSSPSCGETARDKNQAVETYTVLSNCSNSIKEACTLPESTLSDDDLSTFESCSAKYKNKTEVTDECRKSYTDDGPAACACWAGIVDGISSIKQSGTCNANDVMDEVKAGKMTCMDTFQICRQAEDAAVQLVYTCGSGEVANNTRPSGQG